eukprot:scaffold53812_cov35-Phaeocystis_antarctica.AAC.1
MARTSGAAVLQGRLFIKRSPHTDLTRTAADTGSLSGFTEDTAPRASDCQPLKGHLSPRQPPPAKAAVLTHTRAAVARTAAHPVSDGVHGSSVRPGRARLPRRQALA